MIANTPTGIQSTLYQLHEDSKSDHLKIIKGFAKSIHRSLRPLDLKEAYLSISKEQGVELVQLIKDNNLKNIVEFGTSFGISTIYMAQGVIETNGSIITTELIESKAMKAIENFKKAGIEDKIEVRIGDAMETLKNHKEPIDLLFLDGWKDLYLPLFQLLEPNFHSDTIVYVDNADMKDSQAFLKTIAKNSNYQFKSKFENKVVLITNKK